MDCGNEQQHQQEQINTAVMEDVLKNLQDFENSIRGLVGLEGQAGSDLQNTVNHVIDIIRRRDEAEESSRFEKVRSQRVEEDLRHEWEDSREVFERIIRGQNARLRSTRQENVNLLEENDQLRKTNDGLKDSKKRKLEEYNRVLSSLNDAKKDAEDAAKAATDEVEARIVAIRQEHEKNKSASEHQNKQERNKLLFSESIIRQNLEQVRNQLTVAEQQHTAISKERVAIVKRLETEVKKLKSEATAFKSIQASMRESSMNKHQEERKEKDSEISNLKDRLRVSNEKVKELGRWKAAANWEQQDKNKQSEHFKEEMGTLRENKDHKIRDLRLDISGLERTIKTNEDALTQFEERIRELESGKEIESLEAQLGESKQQLELMGKEKKKLQTIIKTRAKKTKEEKESSLKEKKTLEEQLEQATSVKEDFEKKARKLEEDKKEASENAVKAAVDADKQEEKHKMEIVKAVEQALKEAARKAVEEDGKKEQQHEEDKRKAVQDAFDTAAKEARKKEEQHEKDKQDAFKRGVEKGAEKRMPQDTQDRAAQTESNLQPEIRIIKPDVEEAADSQGDEFLEIRPKLNPQREIKKPRSPKRRTQPASRMLPASASPGVQEEATTTQPEQKNGFATQIQAKVAPDFMSAQSAPGPSHNVSSFLTPHDQDDEGNSTSGFNFSTIDTSFNQHQNGGASGSSTGVVRDHRPLFSDILARLQLPASADKTTSTGNAEVAAKTPVSGGSNSPLPGLPDHSTGTVSSPQQLASVFSSESTRDDQSGPQEQVNDILQGDDGSTQGRTGSDVPEGWTDLMTDTVKEELRRDSQSEFELLEELVRGLHDFETKDEKCLTSFLEKLKREVETE